MIEQSAKRKSLTHHVKDCERLYVDGTGYTVTAHHRLVYQSVWDFKDHKVEKILDVGCGRGRLIHGLTGHGFDVTGTEICPSLLAGDLKNLPVYPYSVDDMQSFLPNSYDLVIAVNVVSHVRDVEEMDSLLDQSARIAAKGVLITTGGTDEGQTIRESASWWRNKIQVAFSVEPIHRSEKSLDIHRWLCWWGAA